MRASHSTFAILDMIYALLSVHADSLDMTGPCEPRGSAFGRVLGKTSPNFPRLHVKKVEEQGGEMWSWA